MSPVGTSSRPSSGPAFNDGAAHNDANVLALGARVLQPTDAIAIVDRWIHTKFAGGRHQRRVDKIRELENQEVKRLT